MEKENAKDTLRNFEHFRKKLNNTMYFKETSPEYFEREKKFKIKPSYNTFKEYNAVNEFCFRIRDRISNLMVKSEKDKVFQNISYQEKEELNTLIKNKNIYVCINDTYKNMGTCNAQCRQSTQSRCHQRMENATDNYKNRTFTKKLSFEEMESLIKKNPN